MNESDAIRMKADGIFFSAMEIESDEERLAFVRQSCNGDDRLLERVTRLMAALGDSEPFFSESAPVQVSADDVTQTFDGIEGLLDAAAKADGEDESGKMIGPYTLHRKIGEGGSSNVYVAEQSVPVRRRWTCWPSRSSSGGWIPAA